MMQKTEGIILSEILEKIREKGNQRPRGEPGCEQGHFICCNKMGVRKSVNVNTREVSSDSAAMCNTGSL